MRKIKYKLLGNIFLFGIYILIGVFAFWAFYPYHPLEVKDIHIIGDKTICKGKPVFYEMTYIKNSKVKPTLTKTLVDGIVFHLSEIDAYSPTFIKNGNVINLTLGQIIPETTPEGIYNLHIDARYQVNPLRSVVVQMQTDEFKVKDCN